MNRVGERIEAVLTRLRRALLVAVLMSVAGCGGGPKLNSNETARAFAALTANSVRKNVVCRDVGNTAPGWDYRCWYTIRPTDGSAAFRFDSYVKVDEDSITGYTTN